MSYKTLAGIAHFFRDGAAFIVPAAGTAARDAKPGALDAGWLNLGHVDISTKPNVETEEIMRNVPGRRVLYDLIKTSSKLVHSITLHELSPIIFELLYGTDALEAGDDFNPEEGGLLKGWLKVQEYDGDDALVCTHDVFVVLAPPSDFSRDDKHVKAEIEAKVIYSQLATGTLGLE